MTTEDRTAERKQIAATIMQQINASAGNPLFLGCAGAKSFAFLSGESVITPGEPIYGGLMFRATCSPGMKVIVELAPGDVYNVQIGRLRGVNYKVIAQHEGVYCDSLASIIAGPLKLTDFCV